MVDVKLDSFNLGQSLPNRMPKMVKQFFKASDFNFILSFTSCLALVLISLPMVESTVWMHNKLFEFLFGPKVPTRVIKMSNTCFSHVN